MTDTRSSSPPARRRWMLAALLLSVALNVLVGAVYLKRRLVVEQRPDIYRANRVELFERLAAATKLEIVMLGDSLTDRAEWHELLGSAVVGNRGIAGDTIGGATARIDSVLASQPKVIVVMLGINDLLTGATVEDCVTRYLQLLAAIEASPAKPQIIVQSVLPVGRAAGVSNQTIRKLNEQLQRMCAARACRYLDLFSAFLDGDGYLQDTLTIDGVHVTGRGYERWAELLRPALGL